MKKALLSVAVVSSITTASFAQSKFYVAPSVNVGVGSAHIKTNSPIGGLVDNVGQVLTYGAGLTVGYKLNNFRLETGLRYDISGLSHRALVFGMSMPEKASVDYKFHHFSIPLQAGYEFRIGKRFSVTPLVGVMLSYNAGGSTHVNSIIHETNRKLPAEAFNNLYNRASLWGVGSV